MSRELHAQMLEYTQVTGEALDSAVKIAADVSKQRKAAEARIPGIVDMLKQAGLIKESELKQAAEALADPVRTLDILGNVAERINTEKQAAAQGLSADRLGQAEENTSKAASAPRPHFVGAPAGLGEKRASDQALLRLIESA